ncbi:MAG: hypothetical protein JF599_12390 [Verrucomicrobia bacterium]|nr:hypothetical protein [Verrucomicrobiota bacterium]
MKTFLFRFFTCLLLNACFFTAACSKKSAATTADATPHKHEHHPPHGGTPVVLGDEAYHIELVLDPAEGRLQAFILDGEMENFVRSTVPSLEIIATVDGEKRPLVLQAVADAASGEKAGDTSLFETKVDWLKTTKDFDAVLTSIAIRGTTFSGVPFNFPKGNDHDEPAAGATPVAPAAEKKSAGHHHHHTSPRGGTLVQVGAHKFNIDLVLDADTGKLKGYVVGPHAKGLADVVPVAMPSFEMIATIAGEKKTLVFTPLEIPATGEKPGNTSLFEAQADWLKGTPEFEGVFPKLDIGDATFADTAFHFPTPHPETGS